MANLILKKFPAYSPNPIQGLPYQEWAIVYDTNTHIISARDFSNDAQYARFKDYDLTLIFAQNASLQNDWANVQQLTKYDIEDITQTVEIQQYCEGADGKTVTTTAALTGFGHDTLSTTDPATLETLYLSRSTQSNACQLVINDLELENVFLSYSGATVDINIVASGTNTPITYCLFDPNSSTCQASDTFLSVDASTTQTIEVWVKDSEGFTQKEAIEIKQQANYADKYIVQFYNRSGELCEAKIQQKGYAGAATYPDAGSNPVSLNYREGSSSDAKYDVIKGSECMVSLMSESSFQFQEIFEAEEDEFRLQYYVASTLIWQGFSKNEGYSEAYADFPYEVQLTFIDGLGTLKSKKFIDNTGEIYKGTKSELDIIKICLLNTLHELPIWVNIDLFENNHSNKTLATDTPLDQTYIKLDVFTEDNKTDNCYVVLNKILTTYGAHLFQESGAWHIRTIDDMQNAYDYKEFNAYGQSTGVTTYNPNKALTGANADPLVRIDGGAVLRIIPGFQSLIIEQQLQQYDNIVKNGDFVLFERAGKYSNWNDPDAIYDVSAIIDGDSSRNTIKIDKDAANDTGGTRTSYVYADPQVVNISKDGTSLNITISYIVRATDTAITNTSVKFKIQIGLYLLKKDGTWTNDTGLDEDQYLFFDETTDNIKRNEVNSFTIKTSQIPDGGNMQFWIYRALGTGGYVDGLEVTKVRIGIAENEVKLPSQIDNEINNNNGTYTFEPDPLKLYFSDFTQFNNPGSIVKNQKFLDAQATTATSSWSRSGVNEVSEIQSILGERVISNYQSPTQEVSGDIHTVNERIYFSNVIADPNNSGRKFMISQMKSDEKEQVFNVTLLEVLSEDTTEVYRVFEDGGYRMHEESGYNRYIKLRILES